MGQTERVLRIQQMLQARRLVPIQIFLDELEVSPAQFKRDLALLRDRFQLPIELIASAAAIVSCKIPKPLKSSCPGRCTPPARYTRYC